MALVVRTLLKLLSKKLQAAATLTQGGYLFISYGVIDQMDPQPPPEHYRLISPDILTELGETGDLVIFLGPRSEAAWRASCALPDVSQFEHVTAEVIRSLRQFEDIVFFKIGA